MNDSAVLLRADNLYKSYGHGVVAALTGLSVEVRRGDYLSIMGPSGSGKSTLLNMLGALDRPDRGEVYFNGTPVSAIRNLSRFRARDLGFVFQAFLLLPTLTAVENVQIPMFTAGLRASDRVRKARRLLEIVGLAHRVDHLPATLSVGERQRVAIARALANDPEMILADEPTGNLDSHSTQEILDLFDRLRAERQLTLVVVTHSPILARRADRTVWLQDGHLLTESPSCE